MLQVKHYYIISGFFICCPEFFCFCMGKSLLFKGRNQFIGASVQDILAKSYYLNFKKHRSLICNLNSIMFGINFLFKTH